MSAILFFCIQFCPRRVPLYSERSRLTDRHFLPQRDLTRLGLDSLMDDFKPSLKHDMYQVVINFKFRLQLHQKCHSMENVAFHSLLR